MPDNTLPTFSTPRRSFLARVAGLIAGSPIVARMPWRLAVAERSHSARVAAALPNAATLDALADAVLPAELGAAGIARAASDFQRWMDGYAPGAEANHGYGTGKIERLPADRRPQWKAQLASLDDEAHRNAGQSFAALPRDRRQAIVRTALASERGDALPNPLTARHVALALLAYFYDSPGANDLCYNAEIGRQLCRPLASQTKEPVSLRRRSS